LDPFDLIKIIQKKLDRIWKLRSCGGKPVKKAAVSEKELSQALSQTLAAPHVVPYSL